MIRRAESSSRLLLIEDNPADARLLQETLKDVRDFPFQLVCVDRLAEGLERLEAGGIALVLLDLFLPDSEGFETFATARGRAADVPIIVLSGLADEALALRAVREGAQDYLVKGRDSDLLARAIRYAIERHGAEVALRDSARRLHVLSHRLLQAQEAERRQIARELHDQIGQALTALKLNLQALSGAANEQVRAERISDSIGIADHLLQQIRDMSLDLRPSLLDDLGLIPALRWYVDRQGQRSGLRIEFSTDRFDNRFSPAVETTCFRVAQEALTNVFRHAGAASVRLELRRDGAELRLTVRDDGCGFDVSSAQQRAKEGESVGLLGMQERVQLASGRLEIQSSAGSGTAISAWFPLAAE